MFKRQCLWKSFCNAMRGCKTAVREERNMRIALCFFPPVLAYGIFVQLSRTEFAAVIICLFAVCLAELLNSGIENAVDSVVKKYNESARKAKDMGAGASLAASLMSVAVGAVILYRPAQLWRVALLLKNPLFLAAVGVYIALSVLFIIKGGTNE